MNKQGNIKMLRKLLALGLVLLLAVLGGCSSIGKVVSGITTPAGEFPVEINGVTVNARPTKVVVLSASLADVVTAMGLETQLAAGPLECTQAGLRSLNKIDTTNAQAVLDQNPDLVLADDATLATAQALQEAGATVVVLETATDRSSFEKLYAKVGSVLTGGGVGYDDGIAAAQSVFSTLDDINRVVPKDKITTACYLYDLTGKAVTGDQFGDTVMTYAGVTNVFKSLTNGAYSFEELRMSDPTVIFCDPALVNQIGSTAGFSELTAVKAGRVYPLEPSAMQWLGRTVITAALEISGKSFPELLEESSLEVSDPVSQIESAVSSAIESSAQQEEENNAAYSTLQEGDDNDEVLRLQTRLSELGYLTTEYDGYYGQTTASCVADFQRDNGLEATGVADAATQRKLFASNAKAKGAQETTSVAE